MKLLLVCLLLANRALADIAEACSQPNDLKLFVHCVLESHPDARGAKFDAKKADGVLSASKQFTNPTLEAGLSETDNIGQTSKTVDLRLMIPIEFIGNKRSSRIKQGKAEAKLVLAQSLKTHEGVAVWSILSLYRMRQVLEEIELTEESLQTFSNIKQQYSKRRSLGPRQSVSLDIFSLAEADYSMRLSALETEKNLLVGELSQALGHPFKMRKNQLPKFKNDWPQLTVSTVSTGPDFEIARAEREIAESSLAVAKSNAWPEVSIGPELSVETQNNDRITTLGVGVEMSLPIFNLNGGAKAVALSEESKARALASSQIKNLSFMRRNLTETYQRITNKLKRIKPESLGREKHRRIHKYLKRGVVEASLVIESHRQIVEFREHTNEQELEALRTLWKVRSLNGELLKFIKEGKL